MEYVGVDVSKDSLEVANTSGSLRRSFPNTSVGIDGLQYWLSQGFSQGEAHMVVEPTSTYHHPLVQAMVREGITYTLINPTRTAAFARMQGKRAKTDPMDAQLLASMGENQRPKASQPPEEQQEILKALSRHLEWLEKEIRSARNRLESAQFSPWTPPAVLDSLERTIKQLEKEAEQVGKAIQAHQEQWTHEIELLTSIPGVGAQTALLVLSELPPVAKCPTAKSWVAFCGLNPEPRDSGKSHHSRLSRAGVARVRAGLYLPAVSALRWNPGVRELGARLRDRGKSGRARIVAAMHKLLRICFGVLKSGRPFDPYLHQATALP